MRENDAELVQIYGVKKFPTLIAFRDLGSTVGDVYEGELKREELSKFLLPYTRIRAIAGRGTRKATSFEALELTESLLQRDNCNYNDQNLCLLVLVGSKAQLRQYKRVLDGFVSEYADAAINFFLVEKNKIVDHQEVFGEDIPTPGIVVLRSKRSRYAKYEGEMKGEKMKAILGVFSYFVLVI